MGLKITALTLLLTATPALAIQCPDGDWHDLPEHCDMPDGVMCSDGTWRDDIRWCPAPVSDRPEPRPFVTCDGEGCMSSIVEVEE